MICVYVFVIMCDLSLLF